MCPNCGNPDWDFLVAWESKLARAYKQPTKEQLEYPDKCPTCRAYPSGNFLPAGASLSSPSDPDDPRWMTTPREEDEVETLFW